jgi:hypothetical protein
MTEAAVGGASVARYLFASGDPEDGDGPGGTPSRRAPNDRELDYRVELWDPTWTYVEQLLAVTAHGSIGFAAYYAAIKEYPDRYITLRHKGGVLARTSNQG